MDALIAGEIAKIRVRELHEEAERWRRASRAARRGEPRRRASAPSPAGSRGGEVDRWSLWRFVEPDPGFYGRSG
jgi:hypothetical protein